MSLHRFAARYAASAPARFFAWWGRQLRALLPSRWQALLAIESAQWVLEADGEQLKITQAQGNGERAVTSLPLSERDGLAIAFANAVGEQGQALPRIFVLSAGQVLRRSLSLPAAAAENLRSVLGFELDRQTPFKPDQVYYDCRIVNRGLDAKWVDVELALVPRAVLDAQLAALGSLATILDAVDVRDFTGQRLGYNLLPAERRFRRRRMRLLINLGLVLTALLGLGFATWQTLENRRAAVAELEQQVESRRAEARVVNQLRENLKDAVESANFLAVHRAQQPFAMEMLRELTRLLADDTYLERLTFNAGQLNMTGQSPHAADLLGLLQKSTRLQSPSLSGSIQPDSRTGKDRFTIAANFLPGVSHSAAVGGSDGAGSKQEIGAAVKPAAAAPEAAPTPAPTDSAVSGGGARR